MLPDPDIAWRALQARDARFDGRLFVGVTSTGVYCRPICRVRTPRRENCRWFETAAQAEAQRFRPCLKCRPEVAPGPGPAWSVMDATRTLARQAAERLDALAGEPADDEAGGALIAALAARLGVTDRHLRRIFTAEHGVTPLQYLQTRRLLLAKQLLTDSRLPVTQVALASGFRSVRRFNAAFAARYRLSPTRLRRAGVAARDGTAACAAGADARVELTLGWRPPYDARALMAFFAQRAIPGVESVDVEALALRRSVPPGALGDHAAGWIEARLVSERAQLRLALSPSLAGACVRAARVARRWFDLDAAPDVIDAALAGVGTRLPGGGTGTRLPGALDGFELAVRAVLGQRVTVAAARTLAARIAQRWGTPLATPWPDVTLAFPTPAVLAAAPADELGVLRVQADAIRALAREWPTLASLAAEPLPLDARAQALVERLDALPGIGAWTAHYVAMRWLGWPDAFPPGDVGVLNALGLGRSGRALRDAEALSQPWRPWRAYAVLRLWQTPKTTTPLRGADQEIRP
jgi:AraC family transcriptional regulator of adaptative response / DNA-3-methyladenine glycosylase II